MSRGDDDRTVLQVAVVHWTAYPLPLAYSIEYEHQWYHLSSKSRQHGSLKSRDTRAARTAFCFVISSDVQIVSKKARTILTTQKLLHLLPDRTTATTASAAAAAGATAESNQHHLSVQHETWTKQTAAACAHTANAPPASAEQLAAGHSISRQQKGPEELLRAAVAVSAEPPAAVSSHVQEITGPLYSLVSADIRHSALLEAALQRAGFDVR